MRKFDVWPGNLHALDALWVRGIKRGVARSTSSGGARDLRRLLTVD
jgi:hypothetical protein